MGYGAAASTRLPSRSPDSLPNSILSHLQALSWLLSGEPAPGGRRPRPQSPFSAASRQPEPVPHPGRALPAPGSPEPGWLPPARGGDRRSPLARPGAPMAVAWGGRCRWARGPGLGARPEQCGRGPLSLTCGAERSGAELLPLCGGRVRSPAQRTAAPDVGLGWQQKGGFLAQNFSQAPPLPPGRHKGGRRRGGPGAGWPLGRRGGGSGAGGGSLGRG